MRQTPLALILICSLFTACQTATNESDIENWKNEIDQSEREFAAMAKEKGISVAFLAFAAEEAVLMRNNTLVIGKDAIRQRFENGQPDSGTLTWAPDFVDVSSSGDLGYTYGKYTYTSVNSSGVESTSEGVFHTVWKRQDDGKWKFVWD